MEQASEDVVDQFQAAIYNAGSKALSMLDADVLTKGLETDRRKKAGDTLRHLGAFRYNIGFAGPQSCGKSSLINAIIRYPLMPTCNLATTCTPVELIYGKETRIIVKDEDLKGKIVFDRKCGSITQSIQASEWKKPLQFPPDGVEYIPVLKDGIRYKRVIDREVPEFPGLERIRQGIVFLDIRAVDLHLAGTQHGIRPDQGFALRERGESDGIFRHQHIYLRALVSF